MNDGEVLTNAVFDFPFGGKIYKLKKANLRQVIEWQKKIVEMSKNGSTATNGEMLASALYVALHTADPIVTEDYILDNSQGVSDLGFNETLQLGFLSQQKAVVNRKQNELANQPSGEKSTEL